jgi:transposase
MFPTFDRLLSLETPDPRATLASDPAAAARTTTRLGGRPGVDGRAALAGIIYQLRTGIPWRLLPTRQLGCGSPVTCWRRLRDWQRAGVWQRLHHVLLDELGRHSQVDWSRTSLDSISVRAKRGAY